MIGLFKSWQASRREKKIIEALHHIAQMDDYFCILCDEPNEECACGIAHDCGPDCD